MGKKKKVAKKKTATKTAKKTVRKGPKRKCEKCGTKYHPRKAACPKCGAANPTLKKAAVSKMKTPAKKKRAKAGKPAVDPTIDALNFVQRAGGVDKAQETLDGLRKLFGNE